MSNTTSTISVTKEEFQAVDRVIGEYCMACSSDDGELCDRCNIRMLCDRMEVSGDGSNS